MAARGAPDVSSIDIETAFRVLSRADVEFIVVGGVAALLEERQGPRS